MLKGPKAASRSIIGYEASSSEIGTDFQESSWPSEAEEVTINEGRLASGSGDISMDVSSSSRSSPLAELNGGGVEFFRFCLPCRALALRDSIEPAHAFTFFGFLRFFEVVFCSPNSSVCPFSGTSDIPHPAEIASVGATVSFCELEELELTGLDRIGDPATKGSKPKNDHFLADFVGLGVAGATDALAEGNAPKKGIEPRLRGDGRDASCSWMLCVRSRTAPAVLGRGSFSFRAELKPTGEGNSRSAGVREITDEILPETECPGRAVIVLEVSFETRESGLGINSNVSENPTRLRVVGLDCWSACADGADALSRAVSPFVGSVDDGASLGSGDVTCEARKSLLQGESNIAGLAGALLPRRF